MFFKFFFLFIYEWKEHTRYFSNTVLNVKKRKNTVLNL